MLYYVTRQRSARTINKLLKSFDNSWLPRPDYIQPVSYETLFALRRAPIGHYVFTDLDRLNGYEIDAACEIADALVKAAPMARISNWPNRPLGRYHLLRRLYEAGLNSFNIWRLDEERAPSAYPVFIRREFDARGPETPLLHNEAEFRAAVAQLLATKRGLTGRVAIQYISAKDQAGLHRKYGAFRLGDRIVPQHLMTAESWVVKRQATNPALEPVQEEFDYITRNPHRDQLMQVFELARIEFGRIDYCIIDGRVQTFEINTNPNFPRARITQDDRMARRKYVVENLLEGFKALGAGDCGHGMVRFKSPRPKLQRLRDRPLRDRLSDLRTGWRWRFRPTRADPTRSG